MTDQEKIRQLEETIEQLTVERDGALALWMEEKRKNEGRYWGGR